MTDSGVAPRGTRDCPDGAGMTAPTLTGFLLARIAEDEMACEAAGDDVEWIGGRLIPLRPRVLAECEAKRRIVEMHYDGAGNLYGPDTHFCAVCSDGVDYLKWPCPTLRAVALPCADHPDFDESWRD